MTAEMMLRKIYEYRLDIIEKRQEIYDLEAKIVELSKDAYDIIPNGQKHLFNLTDNNPAIVEIRTDVHHLDPTSDGYDHPSDGDDHHKFWTKAVKITLSNFISTKA